MKKIINGVSLPQRDNSRGASVIHDALAKYWDLEDTYYEASDEAAVIRSGCVYTPNGLWSRRGPIPVAKIKVIIPDDTSYNRYRSRTRIRYIDTKRESCIGFRTELSKYYQAYFYLTTKTLIITNNYLAIEHLSFVLNYLEENGHIVPKVIPELKSVFEEFMNIVEIHEGFPEVVMCPLRTKTVSIGTDPEFEIVHNGQVIRPPIHYKGTSTRIGLDGAGCQIELRPNPGTPEEVVADLRSMFKEINDPVTVIGNTYPLGGHIHIGVGYSTNPTPDLLYLLDYFLGKPTIDLSGSARSGYKRFSAYETKNWGFEYRTPPAAIFWSPEFARLSMKICKEVTECYINKQKIRITIPDPIKEDYLNYCGFTDEEYDTWIGLIRSYDSFRKGAGCVSVNISSFWDETIPSSTSIKSPCPHATWKTGKCLNDECMTCFPTTAPAARELRNRIEQDIREDRARREREEAERYERESEAIRENEATITACRHTIRNCGFNLNDDWSIVALQAVARTLLESGYSHNHPVEIFGLNSSRGIVVNGFPEIEGIPAVEGMASHAHRYGIPWVCRMAGTHYDLLERLINIIIQEENRIAAEDRSSVPEESIFEDHPIWRPAVPPESAEVTHAREAIPRTITARELYEERERELEALNTILASCSLSVNESDNFVNGREVPLTMTDESPDGI